MERQNYADARASNGNGRQPEAVNHLPANLEAERAVLGSILINPDGIKTVAGKLNKDDFFRERHGWVWECMVALHERHEPIDFVTLTNELEQRKLLVEVGGAAFLTDLYSEIPTALYLDHYTKIVKDKAARRRLAAAAQKIVELAYNEEIEVPDMFNRAESALFGVSSRYQSRETRHIREVLNTYFEQLDLAQMGNRSGVPTGFTLLDRILGGLQRSDLIVLAGRPGMGKTALALTILDNASKRVGAHCALFSIEMSAEQCVQRLLSMNTSIDSHRIRTGDVSGDEGEAMFVAANALANSQIFIDDTPAITLSELCSKARRLHAEYGLNLIVVDYMQLIVGATDGRMTREQEISKISRTLKALARELDVPVLVLAQLSRAVESRQDKRPTLSDLRESGAVEQDADVVLFVYREDYYVPDSERQNIADILVAKHRHGATGDVSVYFRKELTQFRDLEIQRIDLDDLG